MHGTADLAPRLLPGDPAPWFQAVTAEGAPFALSTLGGRQVLLAFPGGDAAAERLLREAGAEGRLDAAGATALLVGAPAPIDGLRVLPDRDGAVARHCGVRQAPVAILLDPLLRVAATGAVAEMLALLRRPAGPAAAEAPAPVLVLPRVLEPELCRRLVAAHQAAGGEESGFTAEREGRLVRVVDRAAKRRRDLEIQDATLRAALRERIIRRVVPEIRKAFQFEATRIERYLVACYDAAEAGHFRAHRDNDTPGTAHRRFAVSINLNEAFEGGEVGFPEFGPRRHRAPAGGAVVFSCSLVHEVTPVTRGRRYAMLPFLYDEAARRQLEEGVRALRRRQAGG